MKKTVLREYLKNRVIKTDSDKLSPTVDKLPTEEKPKRTRKPKGKK